MARVIVEIDGERHILVKDKKGIDCDKDCSLCTFCFGLDDTICDGFGEGYHFEKEE